MSLELRLTSFRGGGTRGDRIVKATFRGKFIIGLIQFKTVLKLALNWFKITRTWFKCNLKEYYWLLELEGKELSKQLLEECP